MTIQPPMKHAKTLLFFRIRNGHCNFLITPEEKQKQLEGTIVIDFADAWVCPQKTKQKSIPTKVPIDYTNNGVTETVGKELHHIKQVNFIHNISTLTHSDNSMYCGFRSTML